MTPSADSKTAGFHLPRLQMQGGVFLATLSAVAATSESTIRTRNTGVTENSVWNWRGSGAGSLCVNGSWPPRQRASLSISWHRPPQTRAIRPIQCRFHWKQSPRTTNSKATGDFAINLAEPTSLPAARTSDVGALFASAPIFDDLCWRIRTYFS